MVSDFNEIHSPPAGEEVRMEKDTRDLKEIVKELKENGLRCNCDLDNWQPEKTGHSWVCRIHRKTISLKYHPHEIRAY